MYDPSGGTQSRSTRSSCGNTRRRHEIEARTPTSIGRPPAWQIGAVHDTNPVDRWYWIRRHKHSKVAGESRTEVARSRFFVYPISHRDRVDPGRCTSAGVVGTGD